MVYAAARGFDDVVRRLLDAGVDVNAHAGNELTPLTWAAGHNEKVLARQRSSVSSIFCSRAAPRSTPLTIAAAPR